MNLFSYVKNNPINMVDPSGLIGLGGGGTGITKEQLEKAKCEAARRQKVVEDYLNMLMQMGAERGPHDPFIMVKVAENWEDLPLAVRENNPLSFVANYGHHANNKRLRGGYHLSTEHGKEGVYLHFDAHDPLSGAGNIIDHYFEEVRPGHPTVWNNN